MSAMEIFGFYRDGDAFSHTEIKNSWKGGWFIWETLAKKYKCSGTGMFQFKEVWDLCNKGGMSDLDTVCCLFTLDGVWVKSENLPELAKNITAFQECYDGNGKVGALAGLARILKELSEDDNVIGAAFSMTSISQSMWFQWDDEADEHVPYNLNKEDRHWELFDDFKHIKEDVEPHAQRPLE